MGKWRGAGLVVANEAVLEWLSVLNIPSSGMI